MGNVGKWAIAAALIGAACAKSNATEPGNNVVSPGDAGPTVDAGPPDAGPADAGPPDAGPADGGGIQFGGLGLGPWPIGNVLSIGDLLIFAGAFILLHHACASRLALRRPVRA